MAVSVCIQLSSAASFGMAVYRACLNTLQIIHHLILDLAIVIDRFCVRSIENFHDVAM